MEDRREETTEVVSCSNARGLKLLDMGVGDFEWGFSL